MAFTLYNWSEVSVSLNQGLVTAAIATPSSDTSVAQGSMNLFSYYSLDTLATIEASNYFLPVIIDLVVNDVIMVTGADGSVFLQVATVTYPSDITSGTITTQSFTPAGSVGTSNILDNAVTGPKLAYPMNGVATGFEFDTTTSSTTPGTIRSLYGKMSGTGTTMTSGNLVGVRGEVDAVSASGGFLYGSQGKLIVTGTLSGSVWAAGLFGQLDVHSATINAGQVSSVWGDWGATGATATSMTGARGYAFTNTTANILNAQFYMYGPATNLLELDDNSGAYGATYFVAAGTSAGSAGDTSKCNASKVLHITMNGTDYWIPLFASNS
jgi:hypothetical protein